MNQMISSTKDLTAIAELDELFALQRADFIKHPSPSLKQRLELLKVIPSMMVANRKKITEALHADYGNHPELCSDLIEVLGVAGRAGYVMENLPQWMKEQQREVDPQLHGSSKAYVQYQPKGVVGNIVPWNFPFDLAVGPLAEILGAGNRIIIKPSDMTPACGELLTEMMAANFDREQVAVVTGGIDLARHFSTVPWDHLLYTGNTEVGREVMKAAAENLVPVTLELGGKCPAVVAEDSVNAETVQKILGVKMIKNGQMCVSVDHCLVPATKMDEFVTLAQDYLTRTFEDYTTSEHTTSVINQRHLSRLGSYVDDAKARGAKVIEVGKPATSQPCSMPFTLVVNPDKEALVMKEEIFGPILPLVPYDSLDQAIAHINSGERPLGLYVFTKQPELADQVRMSTCSGGFAVNTAAMQATLPSMGFGGIGHSGMGRHHGIEGFREFSNPRGVYELADDAQVEPLMAPYDESSQAAVNAALGL